MHACVLPKIPDNERNACIRSTCRYPSGTPAHRAVRPSTASLGGHATGLRVLTGHLKCLQVSEEIDEEIIIEGGGDYSVMFDPLDGSSNIDCGVSIGTIYGIFKKPAAEAASVKNVLRVRPSAYCCDQSSADSSYHTICRQQVLAIRGQCLGQSLRHQDVQMLLPCDLAST